MNTSKSLNLVSSLFVLGALLSLLGLMDNGVQARRRGAQQARQGRLFSLFNVVTFRNLECNASLGGATSRLGTCFSNGDCARAGGNGMGSCASGFGVCCILIESDGRNQINRNRTYVQNPGFPSPTTGTNSQAFTINKEAPGVCFLRLDFDTFNLALPMQIATAAAGNAPNDGVCQDQLLITLDGNPSAVPILCGTNDGEHMYLEFGPATADSATLTFSLGNALNAMSTWDILTRQIECGSLSAPPSGCLQYHFGSQRGRITTFNFYPPMVSSHLSEHDYNVCIRQESGFCCVEYQVCADVMDAFSLTREANAMVDAACAMDYVVIEGNGECTQDPAGPLTMRFCGLNLNVANKAASIPICDCSVPLELQVVTDNMIDANELVTPSRGACLEWSLLAC